MFFLMEQVFFLLYNIFKLAHPFVRQFPTAWWYLSDIAWNARSVSIREARPTVGVRRCRFDWKWFLGNKAKKKMLHVIPKFWLMYIGIVHFLLFPPLKTFTKHLHNDYSVKINTLLLRWYLNISSNILMILEIFSTVINSQLTVMVGRLIYTDGKYNARSWSQFDSSQDQIWSPLI